MGLHDAQLAWEMDVRRTTQSLFVVTWNKKVYKGALNLAWQVSKDSRRRRADTSKRDPLRMQWLWTIPKTLCMDLDSDPNSPSTFREAEHPHVPIWNSQGSLFSALYRKSLFTTGSCQVVPVLFWWNTMLWIPKSTRTYDMSTSEARTKRTNDTPSPIAFTFP